MTVHDSTFSTGSNGMACRNGRNASKWIRHHFDIMFAVPASYRVLLPLFVLVMVFIAPNFAFADITQSVHDTQTDNLNSVPVYQGLGTGLDGTASTASGVWYRVYSNTYNAVANAHIYEFSSESGYNTCTGGGSCSTDRISNTNISLNTRPYPTGVDYFMTFNATYDFNPAYWYVLVVGANNIEGGSYEWSKGSATDTYPNGFCFGGACNTVLDIGFVLVGVGGSSGSACLTGDVGNCIATVIPPNSISPDNARATSTSFAIESTGYVQEESYSEGVYVRQHLYNNAAAPTASLAGPGYSSGAVAFCNWLPNWLCPPSVDDDTSIFGAQTSWVNITLDYPLDEFGEYEVATTTDIQQIGRYTLETTIYAPKYLFGVPYGATTLVATSTQFLVATSTWYDGASDQANALIDQLTGDLAGGGCEVNFTSFFDLTNIGNCIIFLFNGATTEIANDFKNQIADISSRVPWGYATRVYLVLSGDTASSTLPSIATVVPAGLPGAGTSFDFSPWAPIGSAVERIDTTEVETIDGSPLAKFTYYWNLMWYIVFGLWLISELYEMTGGFELEHNPESTFTGREGGKSKKYKVVGKSPVRFKNKPGIRRRN